MKRSLFSHGALLALVGTFAGLFGSYVNQHPRLQNFIDREAVAIRRFGFACGVERWPVKTLADAKAAQITWAPTKTNIPHLVGLPSSGEGDRTAPVETTTWQLTGTHIIAFKQEPDSDIHLELQSPLAGKPTMIAEMPLQSCITAASEPAVRAAQLATGTARAAFETYLKAHGIQVTGSYQTVDIPATLRGVGFFDFLHGQRGVAPNGVELHPVVFFKGAP